MARRALAGFLSLFVLGILTTPLRAASLDPALQEHLLGIYHDYNRAVAAGDIEAALRLRGAEAAGQLRREIADRKRRREFLDLSRQMTPDSVEVRHGSLSGDGARASLITLARKTMPPGPSTPDMPPPGTILRSELTLDFVKEGGVWKYDRQTFGMDPDKIAPCRDERFEPISAYDETRSLSIGGRIARVAFAPDHTLVVLRVLDEETCAFLPPRERLVARGFDPAWLAAYAVLTGEGHPHKTDPQKAWIGSFSIEEE